MKVIHIEELLEILGYTDVKAVRNWCSRNDVLIMKPGKIEYVYETEFILAYEMPFINKLKNKFGDDWEQVYNLYKDGNIPALNMLNNSVLTASQLNKTKTTKDCPFTKKIKEYEKNKKNAA